MPMRLHPDEPFEQVMASGPNGQEIILVRVADGVRAYANVCPHAGVGLDYGDGRCLFDGHLECSLHGAKFRCDDGYCFDGPCAGQGLQPIAVSCRDGWICLGDVDQA